MSQELWKLSRIEKMNFELSECEHLLVWLNDAKIKKSRKTLLIVAIGNHKRYLSSNIDNYETNLRLGSLWTDKDFALIKKNCEGGGSKRLGTGQKPPE